MKKFHLLKYKKFFWGRFFHIFELGLESALGDSTIHYFLSIADSLYCMRLTKIPPNNVCIEFLKNVLGLYSKAFPKQKIKVIIAHGLPKEP